MKLSKKGFKFLKDIEGCSLKAYELGDGGYTIGYGHYYQYNSKEVRNGTINKNTVWSKQKCEKDLKELVKKHEKMVNSFRLQYNFTQNQFDALVSYSFNRGIGGLTQLRKNSTGIIEMGTNMLSYWGSNKKYETALKNRRLKECKLYFTNFIPSKKIRVIDNKSNMVLVKWLQLKLGITVDGIWGKKTNKAVENFLSKNALAYIGRNAIEILSKM